MKAVLRFLHCLCALLPALFVFAPQAALCKTQPTLSVATSGTPSTYGASVTFTATISSGPTGTVTFLDGGTSIGTGTISGTTASYSSSSLTAGSHTITASWPGNSNYNSVTSSAITQVVNKATPTLTVATSGTPSTYAASVTFTATISSGPTGTITFLSGGTSIGTGTISGTTAAHSTATLATGSDAITASWPGNSNYNSVTSSAITQVVNKATPTLTMGTSGTPSTYGSSVTFTATISSGPTGTITFLNGGTSIGTATISGTTASYPTSTLTAGSHAITASWPGNLNYNSVTSSAITQVVNKATPTVSWSTPASITYGAALGATQLDASATPAGTFTYSPASDTVLGAGTKTLSVTFIPTDTVDYNNGAASVTLTVNKATPNVNWPTPAAITYGTALSATQLDASAAPAGTFTYSPTSGTVLGAGSRTLSATFTPSDTADYNNATATAILTVNEAVPSITWATPSPIDYGIALSSSQLNPTATIAGLFSPELCIA